MYFACYARDFPAGDFRAADFLTQKPRRPSPGLLASKSKHANHETNFQARIPTRKSSVLPAFCALNHANKPSSFCTSTTPIPAESVVFVWWVLSRRAALRDSSYLRVHVSRASFLAQVGSCNLLLLLLALPDLLRILLCMPCRVSCSACALVHVLSCYLAVR